MLVNVASTAFLHELLNHKNQISLQKLYDIASKLNHQFCISKILMKNIEVKKFKTLQLIIKMSFFYTFALGPLKVWSRPCIEQFSQLTKLHARQNFVSALACISKEFNQPTITVFTLCTRLHPLAYVLVGRGKHSINNVFWSSESMCDFFMLARAFKIVVFVYNVF